MTATSRARARVADELLAGARVWWTLPLERALSLRVL